MLKEGHRGRLKSYVKQDGAGEMDMGQVRQDCVSHGTKFGL